MAGLCWMAVMLVFFLSAENGLAIVDQNRLATIVSGILGKYSPRRGMFSLAVRIPYDQNTNTDTDINTALQQVFTSDPGNIVVNKINNNEVYIGNRVVAAKVLTRPNGGADHAESRVVDYLDYLFNRGNVNSPDLLLFYVYASPCIEKCSSARHRESIIGRIDRIRQWVNYAVVFSKIFIPRSGDTNTDAKRSAALQRIGTSIGLNNIFRCDGSNNHKRCTSCSTGGQVTGYCIFASTSC